MNWILKVGAVSVTRWLQIFVLASCVSTFGLAVGGCPNPSPTDTDNPSGIDDNDDDGDDQGDTGSNPDGDGDDQGDTGSNPDGDGDGDNSDGDGDGDNPDGDGDGDGDNPDGDNPDGDNPDVTIPTAQIEQSIDYAADQLADIIPVFGTLYRFSEDELVLDQMTGSSGLILAPNGQTCPGGHFALTETAVLGLFDYGYGCTPSEIPGHEVLGTLDISMNRPTTTAEASFITGRNDRPDFAMNNVLITGGFTCSLAYDFAAIVNNHATWSATLTGNANFTLNATTNVAGTFKVNIHHTLETFTYTDTDLTITTNSGAFDVTLNNVVVDPLGNGSLIPEGGKLTFAVEVDSTTYNVEVSFDSDTPNDNTVSYKINGGSSATYTLQ